MLRNMTISPCWRCWSRCRWRQASAQNNTLDGALLSGAAGAIIGGAATGKAGGAVAGGIIGAAAGAMLGSQLKPWRHRYY